MCEYCTVDIAAFRTRYAICFFALNLMGESGVTLNELLSIYHQLITCFNEEKFNCSNRLLDNGTERAHNQMCQVQIFSQTVGIQIVFYLTLDLLECRNRISIENTFKEKVFDKKMRI